MFRRAIAFEYLERNPCAGIARLQEAGPRQQSLAPEQAARLLDALEHDRNPIAAAALALMLYTGTRKMECLRGRWEHVDLARRVWLLPRTKSGKVRHVPLSSRALQLLKPLNEAADPAVEHIFANPRTGRPFVSIFYSWDTARCEAGLPQLRVAGACGHPHDDPLCPPEPGEVARGGGGGQGRVRRPTRRQPFENGRDQ